MAKLAVNHMPVNALPCLAMSQKEKTSPWPKTHQSHLLACPTKYSASASRKPLANAMPSVTFALPAPYHFLTITIPYDMTMTRLFRLPMAVHGCLMWSNGYENTDCIKYENGREICGSSIIVEWAKGNPRRPLVNARQGYDECYRCHRYGHWARDCPDDRNFGYRRQGRSGSYRRSRSPRRRRSRSRSRDHRRRSRSRSRSRSRRSRSRSNSRRRGREQSRSASRSKSGSHSRSRSKSKSKQKSRSRSPSASPSHSPSKSRSRSKSASPTPVNGEENGGDQSPLDN